MRAQSSPKAYREISLEVRPWEAEAAEVALLELGATGTASQASAVDPSKTRVVGYFASHLDPAAEQVAEAFLRFRPPPPRSDAPGTPRPRVESHLRPWQEWAAEGRASFQPFQATDDLLIAPPGDVPAQVSGDLLIIRPGSAFGLGTHATTRGCLKLIPEDEPGARGAALDVGTGTGVLALRAVQCGYRPVVACDNDPLASAAAKENLALNDMAGRVQLFLGEMATLADEPHCELIFANLLLNPLLELAESLSQKLTAGGRLIASGIEEHDRETLRAAFRHVGLRSVAEHRAEGWLAVAFER